MAEQFDYEFDELVFNELVDLAEGQGALDIDKAAAAGDVQAPSGIAAPEKSAAERLDMLFDRMKAYRRQLLAVIEYCVEPKELEDVNALIAKMQEHSVSVFAPEGLCNLLEAAGGLVRLDAEGNPFDPALVEPREIVVDGVAYYEIPEEDVKSFYQSTADAIALLGHDDRAERIDALFEERMGYMFVIRAILELASAEEGTQIKAIEEAVLHDERFAGSKWRPNSFLNKLEEADAVAWQGSWKITDYGRELLANIVSDSVSADDVTSALDL